MAIVAALPKGVELRSEEIAATFVVPAPNGCNLDCPFCIVRARGEAKPGQAVLTVQDYVDFLRAVNDRFAIGVVGLQGYEPLLPESWEYTRAILSQARALGLRTSIVTNGTFLADRVRDLCTLDVDGVTVSLDSADAALHDSTRRTEGAFADTLVGLRAAAASSLKDRLIVTSVLQPGKRNYLEGVPSLLAELGIQKWVITPLYRIRKSGAGGLADNAEQVLTDTLRLRDLAHEAGVRLLLDDEFGSLNVDDMDASGYAAIELRQLKRLDQALRLSPDGSLSTGMEILRPVGSDIARWQPRQTAAGAFLDRVRERPETRRVIRLVHA